MPYQIRVRRDTAVNWSDNNPILALGEIGYVTNENRFKIGDGNLAWNSLPFTCDIASLDGFPLPAGNPANNNTLVFNSSTNQWTYAAGGAGGGSVTSVGLSMPNIFAVANTPVTGSDVLTVTFNTQVMKTFLAGPISGGNQAPTFRTIATTDLPDLSASYQVYDTSLQSIITATDPLTGAGAGNMLYLTGTKTFTGTPLTTFGRSLVDDTDAPTARTTLGLGTIATQAASNVAITGGSLSGVLVATGTYNSPVNEAQLIKARKSNATNSPITKGEVVYIVGSTGTHMTVERARADVEATSAYTIGIAATDISDTADGYIMQNGRLTGLSTLTTATYADGDTLYLSESTAGGYRKTLPTAPNHGVFLGFVIKANTGNAGEMDVRIQNYQELEELSDVAITSAATNDFLVYDTNKWVDKAPADARTALGLGTAAQSNTGDFATASHTHGLTTNGDILYHDGTGLARLAKGSSGQVLTATASTINWETPSATGSVPDFILYRLGIT
jgi:hypothetical protein